MPPETPPEQPSASTLETGIQSRLSTLLQQLGSREQTETPARVALDRLRRVTTRDQLVSELRELQSTREFQELAGDLRDQLNTLQAAVEGPIERSSRFIEQELVTPAAEQIGKLPDWAKVSLFGLGVGGIAYAGYKAMSSLLGKLWSGTKRAFNASKHFLAGVAVSTISLVGAGQVMKWLDTKRTDQTPVTQNPQPEQPASGS